MPQKVRCEVDVVERVLLEYFALVALILVDEFNLVQR